ncbi:MAG: HDOD domain-containing protein [Magnetococcus sp. MYC-9]
MGHGLNLKESQRLVRGFSIPTRPTDMLEAMKTQQTFVQNPLQVTAAILRDMALVAQILKAANTLLTGHTRKVESVEVAMVLLGQEKLREITHELFLSAAIVRKESGMQKMRLKSVRAARLLAWLSQELAGLSPNLKNGNLPTVPQDEAYVLGLFHDCGQLVLLDRFADYMDLLAMDRAESGQSLETLEEERYQTHHALLGALLLESWQLPKSLVYVVEEHHRVDAFAGRPVRERKYVVMHAMLAMAEWMEGDLMAWEWMAFKPHCQQLFALEDVQMVALWHKAQSVV